MRRSCSSHQYDATNVVIVPRPRTASRVNLAECATSRPSAGSVTTQCQVSYREHRPSSAGRRIKTGSTTDQEQIKTRTGRSRWIQMPVRDRAPRAQQHRDAEDGGVVHQNDLARSMPTRSEPSVGMIDTASRDLGDPVNHGTVALTSATPATAKPMFATRA
jgi:hypothetical protein